MSWRVWFENSDIELCNLNGPDLGEVFSFNGMDKLGKANRASKALDGSFHFLSSGGEGRVFARGAPCLRIRAGVSAALT